MKPSSILGELCVLFGRVAPGRAANSARQSRSKHIPLSFFGAVAAVAISLSTVLLVGQASTGSGPATITVDLSQPVGVIDPRIFGHFTEETLTSYEGGVSSQLLFNRKFEMPEDRIVKASVLFKGTSSGWDPIVVDTAVTLVPDRIVYYSPTQSQRITNAAAGVTAGIQQKGYRYVFPQMSINQRVDDPFHFLPGERYRVRVAIKNRDLHGPVYVALGESVQKPVAKHAFQFSGGEDWKVYECVLVPTAEAQDGKFMVYIDSPGTVWIDSVSMVREDLDEDGFRKDVLEATRRVNATLIRWPGGWFASDYHWQDGIGPIDKRPGRQNRAWLGYTTNDVGVDEFIALCRKIGADPYICVNVGTGTPEEAAALVEYCNGDPHTRWGKVRAQNGHPEPYRVKAWNVGNEEYLPVIGGTCGKTYGRTFAAYAKAMRAVDPAIELVAVGAFDVPRGIIPPGNQIYETVRYLMDWNKELLPLAGPDMNFYAIHHYEPENSIRGLSAREINYAAMVKAEDLAGKLDMLHGQMDQYAPGGKHFPIALDEWAVWLRADLPEGAKVPPPVGIKSPEQIGLFGSFLTMRDALAEAAVYNLMQRRPGDFAIGCRTLIYAYAQGLLGISRAQVQMTPPALMLELYATRDHCQSLRTGVQGPTFDVVGRERYLGARGAPYLDAVGRIHPDGKTVEVLVVNRNLEDDLEATIEFRGKQVADAVAVDTLAGTSVVEYNSFAEPNRVKIVHAEERIESGKLHHRFPARSVTRLTVRVL
jgi:alpha-N-arabinofuranosidase